MNADKLAESNAQQGKRVLIMTAVAVEREAVLRGLGGPGGDGRRPGSGLSGANGELSGDGDRPGDGLSDADGALGGVGGRPGDGLSDADGALGGVGGRPDDGLSGADGALGGVGGRPDDGLSGADGALGGVGGRPDDGLSGADGALGGGCGGPGEQHGRSDIRFDVLEAGVGPASAAARTAAALAAADYALVVSAGIGGGFVGRAEVGSLAVADAIIAADLGAETPDGFVGVDALGFGSAHAPVDAALAARVVEALCAAGLPAQCGPVVTVSTVTGTAATAAAIAARVPGVLAEAMEGFGVATAAAIRGVPCLEIRAISNPVGPRDRAAWRIPDALRALEAASATLKEVL